VPGSRAAGADLVGRQDGLDRVKRCGVTAQAQDAQGEAPAPRVGAAGRGRPQSIYLVRLLSVPEPMHQRPGKCGLDPGEHDVHSRVGGDLGPRPNRRPVGILVLVVRELGEDVVRSDRTSPCHRL